jgi:hypothetical protein
MATFNSGGFGTVSSLVERPTAVVVGLPSVAVLGATVRLDGSGSVNPTTTELVYTWAITAAPIGSKTPYEPFKQITEDWSSVWFSPDLVGEYIIELTVSSGNFESKAQTRISVRAILIPDGRAIVPDGKFIWSYLRDVWQQVEDRQIFETLWSALIQICGAELLKLYQFDFNKSIRDIQEKMQRRWLAYEPRLELDPAGMTAFLGNEEAGQGGSTQALGREAKAVIFASNELIVVEGSVIADVPPYLDILYSRSSSNVGEYRTMGTNAGATGYRINGSIPSTTADRVPGPTSVFTPQFPFQSRTWALQAPPAPQYALKMSMYPPTVDELSDIYSVAGSIGDVRVGDVAYIATGVNVGFYRITASTGIFIEVDRAPPSSSQPSDQVIIFRPVGIKFAPLPGAVSTSFTVPQATPASAIANLAKGRLITIGGRAYPVLRSTLDIRQPVPTFIITTDDSEVVTGRSNLNWRVPNTLVSPTVDFEAKGVTSGDLLLFDVRMEGGSGVAQVAAQVIGVHGYRLAFVVTTAVLSPGEGYTVSDSTIAEAFGALGIRSVTISPTGEVSFSGDAAVLYTFIKSGLFAQQFWNTEIDLSTGFVTPVGRFFVTPRAVIRNSKIPVDDTVLSVPVLQEWVAQPTLVEKDGKVYQKKGDVEYELPRRPVMLVEGNDYLTDGTTAFDDTVPFLTGTATLEVEGAGFLSRQVAPGDKVSIPTAVSLNLPYIVVEVLSEDKLLLSTMIPALLVPVTTERVVVTRRAGGKYLRLLPGGFTAAKPAPDRFWAEVSYFDNSDAIEANFGIMVGLKREDLDKITTRVSYRQAVAGLMFAYTRGSTIEKVRLGAQILLGLPFAEHRGIIRSMESNYRTDASGVPILGRLLIEDVDDVGVPAGIQRVYTYPIDNQSSDLSGVEVNPATGAIYAVDDIVEAFAPLAKGVGVSDYLTDPLNSQSSGISQLQKFHSFRLRANDNLFNIEEITLVSSFLRRITPSYVAFIISEVMQFGDDVSVLDSVAMVLSRGGRWGGLAGLNDNVGTGLGTPFMFDQMDFSGHHLIRWDDGVFKLRRSGKDAVVADVDHVTGTVSFSGDIVSTVMPGALIKVGDYVIFGSGPNAGIYPITVVTEGVGVTVDTTGKSLTSGIDQLFLVARKISEVIRSGLCNRIQIVDASGVMGTTRYGTNTTDPYGFVIDAGDVIADIPSSATRTARFTVTGNVLDGVMPGDWLLTCGGRLLITDVQAMIVTVIGETDFTPEGNAPYVIVRPSLLSSPSESSWSIVSDGSSYSCDDDLRLMADPGDYLEVVSPTGFAEVYVVDAKWNNYLPVLPADTYTVRLKKKNRPQGPLGFDFILSGDINDQVDIYLRSPNTIISDATGTITIPAHEALDMGAQIGDFIRLYDITQIDNGYGPGVYPIASIAASGGDDVVVLSGGMVDGGTTAWSLLRRR